MQGITPNGQYLGFFFRCGGIAVAEKEQRARDDNNQENQ